MFYELIQVVSLSTSISVTLEYHLRVGFHIYVFNVFFYHKEIFAGWTVRRLVEVDFIARKAEILTAISVFILTGSKRNAFANIADVLVGDLFSRRLNSVWVD